MPHGMRDTWVRAGRARPCRSQQLSRRDARPSNTRPDSTPALATKATNSLLNDGRVLVTGGLTVVTVDDVPTAKLLASTEIYDPTQDRWTAGPDLPLPTFAPRAVTLADGRVFVV